MENLTIRALMLVAVVAALGACTDTKAIEDAAATDKVKTVPVSALPTEILDLRVAAEPVKALETARRSYVEEIGLFSLRDGELVEATLQVAKFNAKARPRERKFQLSVVNKIGGTVPRRVRMGDRQVYFTTATKQTVAAWFDEDRLYVLSIREDYPFPRTLVRATLDLEEA